MVSDERISPQTIEQVRYSALSANPRLKFCSVLVWFFIFLCIAWSNILCYHYFNYLRLKAQQYFVSLNCMFLDKKTMPKIWLILGLNLTIFRGTASVSILISAKSWTCINKSLQQLHPYRMPFIEEETTLYAANVTLLRQNKEVQRNAALFGVGESPLAPRMICWWFSTKRINELFTNDKWF